MNFERVAQMFRTRADLLTEKAGKDERLKTAQKQVTILTEEIGYLDNKIAAVEARITSENK